LYKIATGRYVQPHACPESLLQAAISMRTAPVYRNAFEPSGFTCRTDISLQYVNPLGNIRLKRICDAATRFAFNTTLRLHVARWVGFIMRYVSRCLNQSQHNEYYNERVHVSVQAQVLVYVLWDE